MSQARNQVLTYRVDENGHETGQATKKLEERNTARAEGIGPQLDEIGVR
jgi:GTP cyclohydrolase II